MSGIDVRKIQTKDEGNAALHMVQDKLYKAGRVSQQGKTTWDAWAKPVYVFENGWRIIRLRTFEDLAKLGKLQQHCSGSHWPWVCLATVEYFYVLCNGDGVPRSTIHGHACKWAGKSHPLDAKNLSWITSNYYGAPPSGTGYGSDNLEYNVQYHEDDVKRWRQYALAAGPLGPNNPHKYQLDNANRQLNAAKSALEKALKAADTPFGPGHVFRVPGNRHVVVMAIANRGEYGTDKYTPMYREWLDSYNGYIGTWLKYERDRKKG